MSTNSTPVMHQPIARYNLRSTSNTRTNPTSNTNNNANNTANNENNLNMPNQEQQQQQPPQQPPQQQQVQAQVQPQQGHIKIRPLTFSCTPQENGFYWLQKFEVFCRRANINDDHAKIENFMLLLSGSAETWFMMLPADKKSTYARLRTNF